MMSHKYKMTISRLTVDKLGVKLYDRVSAVIAEIIANSYDADATEVSVSAPMGTLLATKAAGKLTDSGYTIEVSDNGSGMTPDEVNRFYLPVGRERRTDAERGDTSRQFHRKVMGRKGVGKLAPFGVCQRIEIISSGGTKTKGKTPAGKTIVGYATAHLILERSKILKDTDSNYFPDVGDLDGTVRESRGTAIRLSVFDHRRVPPIDQFERQLAQRFGITTANWKVKLIDCLKPSTEPDATRTVGDLPIDKMPNTEIRFERRFVAGEDTYLVIGSDGAQITDFGAGFYYEDGFYPITGWIGYSRVPYRDDLMAGVRIYCRGKIAAQTHIFNLKAGFTGEYDIRSYLVGVLNADWLDEKEDLIRTDRQDILWSGELGQAFESWGQSLVKRLGTLTREPRRKRAWELFQEASKIEEKVQLAFPNPTQARIRENSIEIAKTFARSMRDDEIAEQERVDAVVQLSFLFAPHVTLDQQLREAADSKDDPISVISTILKTARIAELSAFGRIADERIRVIARIEQLKDSPDTDETAFQSLIEEAPWLINPQWAPISANQSFATLKIELQKFYKLKTGTELVLEFSDPKKKPDFVLLNFQDTLEIIEIKRPNHALEDKEMERISNYDVIMQEFLEAEGNQEFKKSFPMYHITLVCDSIGLKNNVHKSAFEGLKNKRALEHITWTGFLLRTRKTHEDFLNEANRLKTNVAAQT